MNVLLVALMTAAPISPRQPDFVWPAQTQGAVTATLGLNLLKQGDAPGRGRVLLTLHLRGPATLEVEGSRLEEDALAGWRTSWATSSWSSTSEIADWEQTLELVQVKPGLVPLPGVAVRFRSGPSARWEEAAWPELLNESRDVCGPVQLPPLPPSPWPGRLRLFGVILAGAFALALLVRAGRRWQRAGERKLSPQERALCSLEIVPSGQAGVTHLDRVIREYLAERFAVGAPRMTNREVLAAIEKNAVLSEESVRSLAALLGWLEMAKFGGDTASGDIHEAVERARAFVRERAAREEGAKGEGRKDG